MAVKLNMLYHNPCDNVVLPKQERTKAIPFAPEEQEAFLKTCTAGDTYDNLFIFAFNTGLRIGELLALTFDCIKDGNVIVNSNLQIVKDRDEDSDRKTKQIITTTKSTSGTRQVPLNAAALQAVNRQRQNNTRGSFFIFYSKKGTPLQRRNVQRNIKARIKKINANEKLSTHSIRHTFATRLLEKGAAIKTISELLGHKSIQITLDIYSHVSNDLKQKTVALLDAII
jgi:integrase